jgi:hypothetical protein
MRAIKTCAHLFACIFVTAVVATFGVAPKASATLLFTDYTRESVTDANPGFNFGTEFTVGPDALDVVSLGVYDAALDGLAGSRQVGIWRVSDEILIGSTTVLSGTVGTLVEDWRFADVAPFTLQANTTYRIVAHTGVDPTELHPIMGSFSLGPGIASVRAGSVNGGGPTPFEDYPGNISARTDVYANAQVVPEPTAALLMGLGLAGLAARRRT